MARTRKNTLARHIAAIVVYYNSCYDSIKGEDEVSIPPEKVQELMPQVGEHEYDMASWLDQLAEKLRASGLEVYADALEEEGVAQMVTTYALCRWKWDDVVDIMFLMSTKPRAKRWPQTPQDKAKWRGRADELED